MGDEKLYKASLTLSIATPVGKWGRGQTLDCVWKHVVNAGMSPDVVEYLSENMGYSDLYDDCNVLVSFVGLVTESEIDTMTMSAKVIRKGLEDEFGVKSRVKFRLLKVLVTHAHLPFRPRPCTSS